jgi:lactoylglutathione lyase
MKGGVMNNHVNYSLPPTEGIVLTHFLTVADVSRAADFYARILGDEVTRRGEPTIIHLATVGLL